FVPAAVAPGTHLVVHSSRPSCLTVLYSLFLFPPHLLFFSFFFFNDTATTEIYTLSLHDALPICGGSRWRSRRVWRWRSRRVWRRSEEHTSELQSRFDLVCRLLLEKKKEMKKRTVTSQGKARDGIQAWDEG